MIDQLGNGLVLGTIIAITSIGLSLVFGVTNLINFSHGEFVTLGATVALFLASPVDRAFAGLGIPFPLAVILAVIVGAGIGAVLELGLFRRLRSRNVGGITQLVVTIGLALLVRHLILIWIGGTGHQYPLQPQRQVEYFGFLDLAPRDGLIIIVSFAVMTGVGLFLTFTKVGTAMRALADNATLAESSGIDVDRIILYTWMLAMGLAALGGVFQGMTEQVRFNMGFALLLLIFAAVILGGIGTAFGAMIGGLIIGLVVQMSAPFLGGATDLRFGIGLALMAIVLLVRPQGIMGRKERVS